MVQEVYTRGMHFVWDPLVLAQLYREIYNFMSIDKFNIIVAHACLLQIWAYMKIMVVRSVGLHRGRDDLGEIALTCWFSKARGYRYPHTLKARRREMDRLWAENLIWISYVDFMWDDDAH